MVDQARSLVLQQVRRVRTRMMLGIVVECTLLAWTGGFLLSAFWFLLQPLVFRGLNDWVLWGVPCGLLAVCTLGGFLLAWMRRPNLIAVSLAIDEKFDLKERVTTFLTLPADHLATPAGQALLNDVGGRVSKLPIADHFPLYVPGRKALVPAGALGLALLACTFAPMLGNLSFINRTNANPQERINNVDTAKIQDELDKLKKNVAQRNQEQLPKSEELKELEKEFEKLINQPLEKDGEKIRERIDEMRKLEDRMKDRMEAVKEKAEKIDAFKKHLKQLGMDKQDAIKEGAAKDLEDALMKGDFDKAKQALEKLAKDLKNDKLDGKKQKELGEQFKKLHDKLQKLMDKDNLKEKLKKDLKEGKIDEEQFQREMDALQQLQDLTDIIDGLEDGLDKMNGKDLGDKLDKAMKRFGELELTDQEIRDILRDQEEIADAMRLLLDALEAEEGDGDGNGNGLKGGGPPGGKRPIDPNDPDAKIKAERSRAQVNPKGQQRITGYARGGNFNKVPAKEVGGAFRQAAQDGPEALDRQRIPDDAADIARDYFKKLGNQK